jgi:hypothetical protein
VVLAITAQASQPEAASFFGILQNKKIIFHDIAENLIGEIKMKLCGFETLDNIPIIWGEMYPYFSTEYGKFKLTIDRQKKIYEFQCVLS